MREINIRIEFRARLELIELLEHFAKEDRVSASALISVAVEQYLTKRQGDHLKHGIDDR